MTGKYVYRNLRQCVYIFKIKFYVDINISINGGITRYNKTSRIPENEEVVVFVPLVRTN